MTIITDEEQQEINAEIEANDPESPHYKWLDHEVFEF